MIKKIKTTLVSVAIYLVAGTCFGIWAFFLVSVSLIYSGPFLEKLIKAASKSVLYCAGVRVKVTGVENVDPQKQYIIMMNHVNIFDSMVLYGRYPGKARGIEEESHFRWPVYGWLVRRIGIIPINRKSGIKALGGLKRAADLIRAKKGFSVAILPEGTRTLTGGLGIFKRGGFLLAMETGLDILPVIQSGAFQINNKLSWHIRPGKVELVIGKPISIRGYSKDKIKELMERTREVFLECFS